MAAIEPFAPDACRPDRSAPCMYWHLKLRALNGERDKLSDGELAFIGIYPPDPRDGWHRPHETRLLASADERDVDIGSFKRSSRGIGSSFSASSLARCAARAPGACNSQRDAETCAG